MCSGALNALFDRLLEAMQAMQSGNGGHTVVSTLQNRWYDYKEAMKTRLKELEANYQGYVIVIVYTSHDTNVKKLGTTKLFWWDYNVYGLKECGDWFHLTGDGGWKNWSNLIPNKISGGGHVEKEENGKFLKVTCQ